MPTLEWSPKQLHDLITLMDFLEIYCQGKHPNTTKTEWTNPELKDTIQLCSECTTTMNYSSDRLKNCPQNPKPTCKNCETHCYNPEQRKKIREIMRYSGMQLIKKGRIGYALHYL
ncbi:MAG: nitrous oxide-stimulated promoter family protein [Candidatus Bathyarchaeota archaeon]|nr:nitrous oxide-stimulated promoter family protein [Candidatus Bathyarchaeota archaeon]